MDLALPIKISKENDSSVPYKTKEHESLPEEHKISVDESEFTLDRIKYEAKEEEELKELVTEGVKENKEALITDCVSSHNTCKHKSPENTSANILEEKESTQKLYSCKLCSKTYRYKRCLKTHARLHKKRLQCEACLKFFADKTLLKRHQGSHVTERKFICPICYTAFPSKCALNSHRERPGKEHCEKEDRGKVLEEGVVMQSVIEGRVKLKDEELCEVEMECEEFGGVKAENDYQCDGSAKGIVGRKEPQFSEDNILLETPQREKVLEDRVLMQNGFEGRVKVENEELCDMEKECVEFGAVKTENDYQCDESVKQMEKESIGRKEPKFSIDSTLLETPQREKLLEDRVVTQIGFDGGVKLENEELCEMENECVEFEVVNAEDGDESDESLKETEEGSVKRKEPNKVTTKCNSSSLNYWYNCDMCRLSFGSPRLWQNHVRTTHKNAQNTKKKDKAKNTENTAEAQENKPIMYEASGSTQPVTNSSTSLFPHEISAEIGANKAKQTFQCGKCHESFAHRVSLERHESDNCLDENVKCDMCSQHFASEWLLKDHILTHGVPKKSESDRNLTKSDDDDNESIEFVEASYACNLCHLRFKSRIMLGSHMRFHPYRK